MFGNKGCPVGMSFLQLSLFYPQWDFVDLQFEVRRHTERRIVLPCWTCLTSQICCSSLKTRSAAFSGWSSPWKLLCMPPRRGCSWTTAVTRIGANVRNSRPAWCALFCRLWIACAASIATPCSASPALLAVATYADTRSLSTDSCEMTELKELQ